MRASGITSSVLMPSCQANGFDFRFAAAINWHSG